MVEPKKQYGIEYQIAGGLLQAGTNPIAISLAVTIFSDNSSQ
jgi:hypothetical protein